MAVDDSYTVSLLHFDGADASTNFTDESAKSWTVAGNAQIDTAQSKFGGAAGLFDGTNSKITTPATTDFQYGTGAFTIDFHARVNGTGSKVMFCQGGVSGSQYPDIWFASTSKTAVRVEIWEGSANRVGINGTITENVFNHLALIRDGNNFYLATNGTLSAPTVWSGTMDYNNAVPISIGNQQNAGEWFNGWLDEFRVSKGIARWTADFTPPTSAYSSPSNKTTWFFMRDLKALFDKGIYRPQNLGLSRAGA